MNHPNPLPFSDSHCHLDYFTPAILATDGRRLIDPGDTPATVLARARRAGVGRVLALSVGAANFDAVRACAALPGVLPAYGLHPLYQSQHRPEDLAALDALLPGAVALGECGLDGGAPDGAGQQEFFRAQIDLARRHDVPLLLHARGALETVLQLLERAGPVRFVVHSFTGSDVQLARLLRLGGYVGVGGTCSYERARRLRRQLATLPADRYLLETDAPDQPLSDGRGAVNYPETIPRVAAVLAELRGVPLAQVSAESEANFSRFFGR